MLGILKPDIELELDEGEHIVHYTRRHWVLLLIRISIPLLFAAILLALAFYRAIGGVFFSLDAAPEGRLVDPSNIIFILLIAAILFWWTNRNTKKKSRSDLFVNALVLFAVLVLGFAIYFRYQGGRVFSIEPGQASSSDLVIGGLFLFGLLALATSIYILLDWANDFLILTNVRVVYDDTQLLVRHVQQDILIDNIQQVNLSADSYVAYFLGYLALWRDQFLHFLRFRKDPPPEKVTVAYGKLVIGSLSARRLVFDWAYDPTTMHAKINAELGQLRKRQAPDLLRQIIEDQIYGSKRPPGPKPAIYVEERKGPIPWIFHSNPEIQGDQITWRPYWIFLVLAMFPAIAVLILATVLLILAARVGLIGGAAFWIWLPIALICIGRIIWVREEHENDKYVLQLERIIDVDKKPFGPESSRVAPLGNIQDISFDQSFVESILGYGDVSILTGGAGGKFTFKHVPDPRGVQATINDYLTDFKKREKERAQQATIDLLKQYHDLQREHSELRDDAQFAALVSSQVGDILERELPAHVEREVATQLPREVERRVITPLRRQLSRAGQLRFRRRRLR
jgi:hypothetical protein